MWRYKDFHHPSDPDTLTLAEVRASQGAGRIIRLPASSQRVWYRRLFYEGGHLEAEVWPLPLPKGLSPAAHRAAEGYSLLLALRDEGAAPYTREFAGPWCGMGERQAGKAIGELRESKVLVEVGKHGRLNLYLPQVGATSSNTLRKAA